jgi:hypothetical protein
MVRRYVMVAKIKPTRVIAPGNGVVRDLTPKEAKRLFDLRARQYFKMNGDEFIAAWKAGKFADDPDRPEVMRVALLLPLVG